jgi:hypothetical protein
VQSLSSLTFPVSHRYLAALPAMSYFVFVDSCWVAVDVDGFVYTERSARAIRILSKLLIARSLRYTKALRWKCGALFFGIDGNPARALSKYRFRENTAIKADSIVPF